jgi:hypothetical protein
MLLQNVLVGRHDAEIAALEANTRGGTTLASTFSSGTTCAEALAAACGT